MCRFGSFAVLLTLMAASTLADQPSSRPADPPSPPPKVRLAVLDFRVGENIPASGGASLANIVRAECHRSDRYDLIDRELIVARMTEKDFTATTECDQVKCLVKFGKSLDAQKIVGGFVTAFGKAWTLTIRLVDVNTGREEKTFTRDHRGEMEELLSIAREGAEQVFDLTLTADGPDDASGVRLADLPKTLTLDLSEGVKMELILIPAGEFMMGSPQEEEDRYDDEGPRHRVRIGNPFYMGKYEVTQGQWQAVMGENPSHFKGDDRLPVEQVSWDDGQAFCKRLSSKTGKSVRLPTEAEWEYACRASTTTSFHFGKTILTNYANYNGNFTYGSGSKGTYWERTTPVGDYPANFWGLHDMHGNVAEWCLDIYHENYSGAPTDASAWTTGGDPSAHVLRGGSWFCFPRHCRSASRDWNTGSNHNRNHGLRAVCLPRSTN